MPTSTFEGLADPPLSIERWNLASRMLERVSVEVWLQTHNVCIFTLSVGNKYRCFFLQEYTTLLTPHRLKERAAGRPVVMMPNTLYSDDKSGNKSKKWHKIDRWCILFADLPREMNMKHANIHFLCCSDILSFLDMAIIPGLQRW